jgi:hypothetical protein
MARLESMLVAQTVLVDRHTNSMSIMNVIEEIIVPKALAEPAKGECTPAPFSMTVLGIWRRSKRTGPESVNARLRICGPQTAEPLGMTELQIDLSGRLLRQRTMVKFDVFPYTGAGVYRIEFQFKLGSKWLSAGTTEITVRKAV